MPGWYGRWIQRWERELVARDRDRFPRPLEWGWEWLRRTPVNGLPDRIPETAALDCLREWNIRALSRSPEFFSAPAVRDFELRGQWLQFSSPAPSGDPANDQVRARWFEPRPSRSRPRAVIVLPQWNADAEGHVALCRGLQRLGIAALRLSLPWHDARKPSGLARAEYAVDANLGRTIHAARQAVCDVRACLDWLQAQGYEDMGILGTSLGSCYALLASSHEPRLKVNVFNHVSPWFGDVVWTGLATRHVRDSLAGQLNREQLRASWLAISPAHYLPRMAGARKHNLLIYARYDLTFLPELSRQALAEFKRLGIPHEIRVLPCGHNTTGQTPFQWLDGYWMVQFLRRWL